MREPVSLEACCFFFPCKVSAVLKTFLRLLRRHGACVVVQGKAAVYTRGFGPSFWGHARLMLVSSSCDGIQSPVRGAIRPGVLVRR